MLDASGASLSGQSAEVLQEAQDIELLVAAVQRNRLYLGTLVSVGYEMDSDGEVREARYWEGAFERALSVLWADPSDIWGGLHAVNRLRANADSWARLWEQVFEAIGNASKWPGIARLMAEPAGNA